MPVSPFTYLYIILTAADVLCSLLALSKRNSEHLTSFAVTLPWLLIGLLTNLRAADCGSNGSCLQ